MIKIKGLKVTITGQDAIRIIRYAKEVGLSTQDWFTGMLWEHIMELAREGVFKRGKIQKHCPPL